MNFKGFSLKKKLVITFLIVGISPMIISNVIAFKGSNAEMSKEARERASIVALSKASQFKMYFDSLSASLVDLSASPASLQALTDLSSTFESFAPNENSESFKAQRAEVESYYTKTFGSEYEKKSDEKFVAGSVISKLDPITVAAQHDFIVKNENPLGKKDQLVSPSHKTAYGEVHAKYHTYFRDYITRHALYDLFLVNADGRVIYTVFKETDFGTSLKSGPWSDSGLARVYKAASSLKQGEMHIEDYARYAPSYEAPAWFASTPIFRGGRYVGALIIQIPMELVTNAANDRTGLGEKGEILFIGKDGKLRADTFRNKSTHNVAKAFDIGPGVSVDSEAVKHALAGETGSVFNKSYDGTKTIAYFMPIKLGNLTWYAITELDRKEVEAGIDRIGSILLLVGLFGSVLICIVAMLFGSSISKSLTAIADILNKSSHEVSSSSLQSAESATQLSEAATEQAASLQQTMASIEEISAMVAQNADSAVKAQGAVNANQESTENGSRSVDDMLQSVGQIKETNDEILAQMENSNREFAEIVRIISEIGAKTTVINDIVFQTKLLSFNASIEAARAGEHGKGFSVVAEEVGNLAQMSGNAAHDISTMLTDSIRRVNSIVEQTKSKVEQLVETGRERITTGQVTAEKCREALAEVTANAKVVANMITEITHASKEQAQGVHEINKAISQLDQVTQQNTSVAHQSSAQAENLSQQATELSSAVEQMVVLINGKGQAQPAAAVVSETGKSKKVTAVQKAESQAAPLKTAKVLPLKPKTKEAPKPLEKMAMPMKKAAGSDLKTPSRQDPGFEDL